MPDAPAAPEPSPGAPATPHLTARPVPWQRAFAWYGEAMRLFKRAPATWIGLALAALATEFALEAVPEVGPPLGRIVDPLVSCGMVYAAAYVDRGAAPSIRLALRAFRAPAAAIVAVILASFTTLGAETLTASWLADVNLLASGATSPELSVPQVSLIFAAGILASLPVTFVPFHVLLERVGIRAAFAASWRAFVANPAPLLAYAGMSLALLLMALLTMGIGLALALPLWAASSFAAWKDVFAIGDLAAIE